jgi:cellulose synthase/poly-beta-1,6-N-acetylglucosamine synthase-like glycosyltransferase
MSLGDHFKQLQNQLKNDDGSMLLEDVNDEYSDEYSESNSDSDLESNLNLDSPPVGIEPTAPRRNFLEQATTPQNSGRHLDYDDGRDELRTPQKADILNLDSLEQGLGNSSGGGGGGGAGLAGLAGLFGGGGGDDGGGGGSLAGLMGVAPNGAGAGGLAGLVGAAGGGAGDGSGGGLAAMLGGAGADGAGAGAEGGGGMLDKLKHAAHMEIMGARAIGVIGAKTHAKGGFVEVTPNDSIDPTVARYDLFFGDVEHMFNLPMYPQDEMGNMTPGLKYFAICMTCYNEKWGILRDSLMGIADNMDNLNYFLKKHPGLRPLTPSEVCCVAMFDGRKKMSGTLLEERQDHAHFLTESDAEKMQAGMELDEQRQEDWKKEKKEREDAGEEVDDEEQPGKAALHFLTRHDLRMKMGSRGNTVWSTAFDCLFCVKEENGGRMNSHLWMFHGICPVMNPEYVLLLDCGTKMGSRAMLMLYHHLESNASVGGVCGQIIINEVPCMSMTVSSQHFELKADCCLTKPMESIFGCISEMPYAFCAWRFEALEGIPLNKYFFLESFADKANITPFIGNMYLAENRILCFEVFCRHDCDYVLQYVHGACAKKATLSHIGPLLEKRKHVMNGTFFATLYVVENFYRVWTESAHPMGRKFILILYLVYSIFSLIFTLLLVGNSIIALALMLRTTMPEGLGFYSSFTMATYIWLTVSQVVYGVGNDPANHPEFYKVVVIVYGCISLYAWGMLIYMMAANLIPSGLMPIIFLLFIAPYIGAFLHGELVSVLKVSGRTS